MPYTADECKDLIAFHHNVYDSEQKDAVESARDYYNCRIPKAAAASLIATFGLDDGDNLQDYLVTKHLIFALIDNAVNTLVGGNPTASAMGLNPDSVMLAPLASGRLDAVLSANRIRRQLALSLVDAGTTGYGVFKTLWSPDARMSATRAVDPVGVYFDLHDARLPEDIGYWIHTVPIPFKRFGAKARQHYKRAARLNEINASMFPERLDQSRLGASSKSPLGWVIVYEIYDEYEHRVYHYHAETNQFLMQAGYDHPCPFDLYNLNLSGRDCRGISEATLVANAQQSLTDLLTLVKAIAYGQLEKTIFDLGLISKESVKEAEAAPLGAKVGVNMTKTTPDQKIADAFTKWPSAESPEPVLQFISLIEEAAAFASALAAAQRGAAANVRTATEAANIAAQSADRLSNRRSLLYECLESVCYKILAMDRRYLRTEEWVLTGGTSGFSRYDIKQMRDPQIRFRITAHSPVRQTPAVANETTAQLLPYLQTQRAIDQDELAKSVARNAGINEKAIVPDAELQRVKNIEQRALDAQADQSEKALGGDPSALQALAASTPAEATAEGLPAALPAGAGAVLGADGVPLVGDEPITSAGIATPATPAYVGS